MHITDVARAAVTLSLAAMSRDQLRKEVERSDSFREALAMVPAAAAAVSDFLESRYANLLYHLEQDKVRQRDQSCQLRALHIY